MRVEVEKEGVRIVKKGSANDDGLAENQNLLDDAG